MTLRLWDAEFPLIRLEGGGATQFLHGQTSADVCGAKLDVLVDACLLTTTGKVRALLEVRADSHGVDALVLAGDAKVIHAEFDAVIFPADNVRLLPLDSCRRIQRLTPADTRHLERHWLAEDDGLPLEWLNLPIASQREVEHWRIRRNLPLGPEEVSGNFNPLELGLEAWVSLSKGCYLGQETIAKLTRTSRVRQRLCSWQAAESIVIGTRLNCSKETILGRYAGVVTSSMSVEGNGIGLAMIHYQALNATSLIAAETSLMVELKTQSIYPRTASANQETKHLPV